MSAATVPAIHHSALFWSEPDPDARTMLVALSPSGSRAVVAEASTSLETTTPAREEPTLDQMELAKVGTAAYAHVLQEVSSVRTALTAERCARVEEVGALRNALTTATEAVEALRNAFTTEQAARVQLSEVTRLYVRNKAHLAIAQMLRDVGRHLCVDLSTRDGWDRVRNHVMRCGACLEDVTCFCSREWLDERNEIAHPRGFMMEPAEICLLPPQMARFLALRNALLPPPAHDVHAAFQAPPYYFMHAAPPPPAYDVLQPPPYYNFMRAAPPPPVPQP